MSKAQAFADGILEMVANTVGKGEDASPQYFPYTDIVSKSRVVYGPENSELYS